MRPPRPPWLRRLGVFLGATAFALFLFGRRYSDALAHSRSEPALGLLLVELTSVYGVLALLPAVARIARRYRLSADAPMRWPVQLGAHAVACVVFSAIHTSLSWGAREVLFVLAGLGPYDYGALPLRYLLELPIDGLLYAMLVLGVEKVDRLRAAFVQEVRAAELETCGRARGSRTCVCSSILIFCSTRST